MATAGSTRNCRAPDKSLSTATTRCPRRSNPSPSGRRLMRWPRPPPNSHASKIVAIKNLKLNRLGKRGQSGKSQFYSDDHHGDGARTKWGQSPPVQLGFETARRNVNGVFGIIALMG